MASFTHVSMAAAYSKAYKTTAGTAPLDDLYDAAIIGITTNTENGETDYSKSKLRKTYNKI